MDIVIKGRNVEVPEHYRAHVGEKLARLERYDKKMIRYEVELFHEPNPRQAKNCQRVEITGMGHGEPVCAEASASDFYGALDAAVGKMESRLRKHADRRRVHYGRRCPESVAEATSVAGQTSAMNTTGTAVLDAPETEPSLEATDARSAESTSDDIDVPRQRWDGGVVDHQPGRIVREKDHSSEPMSVDQALSEMELVGHDFYLFHDSAADLPSVVYRRRGFNYGVIRLR